MAFISNVGLRANRAASIIKKVYNAINKGGTLVIKDIAPCNDWAEAFYALAHKIEILIHIGDVEEYSPTPTMQGYTKLMKESGFREAKVLGWVIDGWNSMAMGIKC